MRGSMRPRHPDVLPTAIQLPHVDAVCGQQKNMSKQKNRIKKVKQKNRANKKSETKEYEYKKVKQKNMSVEEV